VAVGLVADRQDLSIGEWTRQYLSEREGDLKPASIQKLDQTRTKLLVYFEPSTALRDIAYDDAAAWRRFLKELGLSEATIKTHSGNAKTIISEAVRRKLIAENPFQRLKSGPTASRYTRYVTPDQIERVIEACPNPQWRLLFGLARYAGLRVPSETRALSWDDIDFGQSRMTIRSPKTERHAGHEQRMVPIQPRLMCLIQERFDVANAGDTLLATIPSGGAATRRARQICDNAGVEPWQRLWQTLRQSCEKEWAMTFPQFAVSKWIGHSITVSGRHYANAVPDELFDRAATWVADGAQRNAQRKAHETPRNAWNGVADEQASENPNSVYFSELRPIAAPPPRRKMGDRGDSNPRPPGPQPGALTD